VIAIAVLLAQAITPPPAPVPAPPRPAEEIWMQKCKLCHGEDGRSRTVKGRKLKAPDFTGQKWQTHTDDREIVEAIENGIPKREMPAFKDKLTPEEIQSLKAFVRAFGRK